ncbi:MAG: EF-hand domain-containing protein [Caulobacter sp.]|nr:EF-hand domain-containing protein [Caulobacter sp.]
MNLSSVGSTDLLQQMRQAMFSKADANSDGQLSSDEFLSIGQNVQGEGSSGSAKPMQGGGFGLANFGSEMMGSMLSMQMVGPTSEEIFAGADADSDGLLTADELAADMAAHAPPGIEDSEAADRAAEFLATADTDGDGSLSAEEFDAARPSGPPPGSPPGGVGGSGSASGSVSEEESSYDPMDTNQDGTVSMTELLASLQSAESQATGFSTEVADLFKQLVEKLTSDTESTVSAAA